MNTSYRVVAICAALTLVCSTAAAQTSPRRSPAPTPSPTTGGQFEYQDGQAVEQEFVQTDQGIGCGPTGGGTACGATGCGGTHCGDRCGCTDGCAMHVGYPRCFNFRSPCTGGGSCGCCGTLFGEMMCDIRDWGARMRSYRAASCSSASCSPAPCSSCGSVDGACSCSSPGLGFSGVPFMEPSCEFEPGCGLTPECGSCFRWPSLGCGLGGLSCLFGGCGTTSCGCNTGCNKACGGGCNVGSTCHYGNPRDAAAYGNSWYPANGGSMSYPMTTNYPQGGNFQEAPIEPIPAPHGAISGNYPPGPRRKSIHYYTQTPPAMQPMGPAAYPATAPMTQIARAPQSPSASVAPLPAESTEPEVRVHEEIPAAPNSIRRMSFEFGAHLNNPSGSSTGNATVRFADDEE